MTYPLAFPAPMHSGGPFKIKKGFNFFRGKTNIGATVLPVGDMALTKVTFVPRSPKVTEPKLRIHYIGWSVADSRRGQQGQLPPPWPIRKKYNLEKRPHFVFCFKIKSVNILYKLKFKLKQK